MSKLKVSPGTAAGREGTQLCITPASAGWRYVGFETVKLSAGQVLERATGSDEACIVLLSGLADAAADGNEWPGIGRRMSVFEGIPPYSLYVPKGKTYRVAARSNVELAVCTAPGGDGGHPARLIAPDQVGVEMRGYGSLERRIQNLLPEQEPADRLLVVEVFTPNGHWSSYPPHKHDRDRLPEESLLEETYYYKIRPEQGFAVQRVYTDDGTLDETLVVKDSEAVLVPRGYHPVSAPPGYDVYYLNVMAGPHRTWKFHNDPNHQWILKGPDGSA